MNFSIAMMLKEVYFLFVDILATLITNNRSGHCYCFAHSERINGLIRNENIVNNEA
jgi:hypothetical protein